MNIYFGCDLDPDHNGGA